MQESSDPDLAYVLLYLSDCRAFVCCSMYCTLAHPGELCCVCVAVAYTPSRRPITRSAYE